MYVCMYIHICREALLAQKQKELDDLLAAGNKNAAQLEAMKDEMKKLKEQLAKKQQELDDAALEDLKKKALLEAQVCVCVLCLSVCLSVCLCLCLTRRLRRRRGCR